VNQECKVTSYSGVFGNLTVGDFIFADGTENRTPVEIGIKHLTGHACFIQRKLVDRPERNQYAATPLIAQPISKVRFRSLSFPPASSTLSPKHRVHRRFDVVTRNSLVRMVPLFWPPAASY